jgi:hypothetical protein
MMDGWMMVDGWTDGSIHIWMRWIDERWKIKMKDEYEYQYEYKSEYE